MQWMTFSKLKEGVSREQKQKNTQYIRANPTKLQGEDYPDKKLDNYHSSDTYSLLLPITETKSLYLTGTRAFHFANFALIRLNLLKIDLGTTVLGMKKNSPSLTPIEIRLELQ